MLSNNWDIAYGEPSPMEIARERASRIEYVYQRANALKTEMGEETLGLIQVPGHFDRGFAVVKAAQLDRTAHGEPFPLSQYNRWMVDRFLQARDAVRKRDGTPVSDSHIQVCYQLPPLDALRVVPDPRVTRLEGLLKYDQSVHLLSVTLRHEHLEIEPAIDIYSQLGTPSCKLEALVHALAPWMSLPIPGPGALGGFAVLARATSDTVYREALCMPRILERIGGELIFTTLSLEGSLLPELTTHPFSEHARILHIVGVPSGVWVGRNIHRADSLVWPSYPREYFMRAMLTLATRKTPEVIDGVLLGRTADGTTVSFAPRPHPTAALHLQFALYVSAGTPSFDRSGKLRHGMFLTYDQKLEGWSEKPEYRGMQRTVGRVSPAVRDVAEQLRQEISRVSYGAFTFSPLRRG